MTVRSHRVARRRDCGSGAGQRDVRAGHVEDFQLIDARLQVVRLADGEADALRLHRCEAVGVHARVHRWTFGSGFRQRCKAREQALNFRHPQREPFFLRALRFDLGRAHLAVLVFHARDERLHGVVIPRRDGVEFVVMTPGAADAQAEKRLADVHHDLVERILPCEPLGHIVRPDLAGQKHRCREEKSRRRIFAKRITDDLLADELVVGRVLVEGADDIVAIRPGVGAFGVHLEAVRVRVAHHIQPVLRPALAVAR